MIGQRIKELRNKRDKTQRELADFLGLTPKMISFYELEERFPPHDIIIKLSQFFNVSTDYLLGITDTNQRASCMKSLKRFNMFSERLKELRHNNKLTQQELANILKVSASTIGMYEQGRRSPDIGTLNQVAEHFDVSVDWLLGRTDINQRASVGGEEVEERIKQLEKKVAELEVRIQEQPKELKCALRLDISDSNANDLIKKYRQSMQISSRAVVGI